MKSLFRLLFCTRCLICGRRLSAEEDDLCTACRFELPRPWWHAQWDRSPLPTLFYELQHVERATALLAHTPGNHSARLIHALKYGGRAQLGVRLGRMMAAEWQDCGFFDGIDAMVPVPLAPKRERRRGYNQSLMIARGISSLTDIPVITDGVRRKVDNVSQTALPGHERATNVDDIFTLTQPSRFTDRHLLLVDDVITTGSTLLSLGRALATAGGVTFSFAALGITKGSTFEAERREEE